MTPKLHDESPYAVGGLDIRSLPIGPVEARVLSCVNGRNTREDIAAIVGLSTERVAQILERLAELGAVRFDSARSAPHAERRSPAATARSGAYRIDPVREPSATEAAHHPSAEPPASVDPVWRGRVLALHEVLDVKNHYELLGLEPNANDAAIRAAYREVVMTFHPDRHFGKHLAELGPKLLQVFSRLTTAYEVLARAESRAVYDRSLASREGVRTRPLSSVPTGASQQPGSSTPPAVSSSTSSMRPAVGGSAELEQRKRALARKLGHSSSSPPAPASSPAPSPSSTPNPASAAPYNRYENQGRLRNQQLEHYVGLADAAAEKRDLVSACNFLKLACSLAPQDLPLADRLKALEQRTAAELWETYAERARQETLNGEWAAAVRSYERAALGHPSATLFERVAFCSLQARGDLKRATEFAQRAVSLGPENVRCRLTLVACYAAAKLRENVLAELEQARRLAPEAPEVKEWIRRAAAGEL